jgi:SAM-dependent methyltransferase
VGRVLELGAGGGQSALAAAQAGHEVTAVELVPRSAAHARTLVSQATPGTLRVLEDSFYTLALAETFDAICYWDGFGVGTDEQQHILLKRIAGWLAPEGRALVDINTPWYWAKVAGRASTILTLTVAVCLTTGGRLNTPLNESRNPCVATRLKTYACFYIERD